MYLLIYLWLKNGYGSFRSDPDVWNAWVAKKRGLIGTCQGILEWPGISITCRSSVWTKGMISLVDIWIMGMDRGYETPLSYCSEDLSAHGNSRVYLLQDHYKKVTWNHRHLWWNLREMNVKLSTKPPGERWFFVCSPCSASMFHRFGWLNPPCLVKQKIPCPDCSTGRGDLEKNPVVDTHMTSNHMLNMCPKTMSCFLPSGFWGNYSSWRCAPVKLCAWGFPFFAYVWYCIHYIHHCAYVIIYDHLCILQTSKGPTNLRLPYLNLSSRFSLPSREKRSNPPR